MSSTGCVVCCSIAVAIAPRAPEISPVASRARDCMKCSATDEGLSCSASVDTRFASPGSPSTVNAPLRRYQPSSVSCARSHTPSSVASDSAASPFRSAPRAISSPTSSATGATVRRSTSRSVVLRTSRRSRPLRPSGTGVADDARVSTGATGTSAVDGLTGPIGDEGSRRGVPPTPGISESICEKYRLHRHATP